MKVVLFLVLFGAGMLAFNLFHQLRMRQRLATLSANEATHARRMGSIVLTQGLIITGLAWLAAGWLYLGDIQVDYTVWRKWFSGAMVLLMAGFSIFSYVVITRKIRRLGPAEAETIKQLTATRSSLAALFGFFTMVMLISYLRH